MEGDALPSNRDRLLIELEFVQNLANPTYLHYLAQNKYLDDEAFMAFLEYLQVAPQQCITPALRHYSLTTVQCACQTSLFLP